MTTFTSIFESKVNEAVLTKNLALICQNLIEVFEQSKTFHQFHDAWLKFEGFKYFRYEQGHHQNTFSVIIENCQLNDDESPEFGLSLYMLFNHNYRLLEANADRIDYHKVMNSYLDSNNNLDFSKF